MRWVLAVLVGLFFVACPAPPGPLADGGGDDDGGAMDAPVVPMDASVATGDAGLPALAPLKPGAAIQHDLFATGRVCGDCHSASPTSSANRDERNEPVGLYEWWSASAMGNSARDPLFRAALENEQARAPAAASAISNVCLGCHAPMAKVALTRAGLGPATFENTIDADGPVGALARDGVSCTLCHQVEPTNFGQPSSFSANFTLGTSRRLYGPYATPFANPMVGRTGFTPVQGAHLQESALCGTCHVLQTEAVTEAGALTGHLMGEQLTYLEWRHSAFSTEGGGTTPTSCQTCHMPDTQANGQPLATRLAHRPEGGDFPPVGPRGPFSRHGFAGANTVLPKLLRAGRAQLAPDASDDALLEAEARARAMLRQSTGRVTVSGLARSASSLAFRVQVENLAGHKLPSGYPSRRAFLQVRVLDATGAVLAQVAAVDPLGRLLGGDGQPLEAELRGGPIHPHRTRVTSPDEPLVYESVMKDRAGAPSFDLLGAEGFLKDNRLLPRGHADSTTGPLSTAPVAVADGDFGPGVDSTEFLLAMSGTPARVEVRLAYQTMSPRYLDELLRRPTRAGAALSAWWTPGLLEPELVAEATALVP
jgi:hypothetical protein